MKKLYVLFAFVICFSVNAQVAFEENFETKTTGLNLTTDGYQLSQSSGYTGIVTATVKESGGNKWAQMVANVNASAGMQIMKTINVVAGRSYTFEVESRGEFKRQLRVYSTSNTLIASSIDYKPETDPEKTAWFKQSVTFLVPAGQTQINIAFYHYWSGTIDLDNFKVFQTIRQTEFYLSASGNDANKGTIDAPWKTLDKISATTLYPGDKVFFKKGDRFDGHYVVNGSGIQDSPITITSYGTGEKPIITGEVGAAGGGDYKEAILVENQDNLIFDGLDVRNNRLVSRSGVSDTDAYGIAITNSSDVVMKNFVFRNMTIQNVYAVQPILDTANFDTIQVSGMQFSCSKNTVLGKEKNIQEILIEDSYFTNLQRFGIQFKHSGGNTGIGNDAINRNMNITVRNNEFYYNGGTGVLPNSTYNCLIENNIFDHPGASTDPRMPGRGSSIWNIRSINTIMQYNICLSTRGYLDSYGIHIDIENENTFVQYNYMDDCEGGFIEILRGNKNAVYRFNVSTNSGFRESTWVNSNSTIYVYSDRWTTTGLVLCDGVYINNNTVMLNKPFKPAPNDTKPFTTSISLDGKNMFVYNNIFSSTNGSSIGGSVVAVRANETPFTMKNNLFEGAVNPTWINMDTNPQKGAALFYGLGTTKYPYQVTEGSLAINNGTTITGPIVPGAGTGVFKNVPAYPNVDFYGNPIDLSSGTPNIGAYNGKTNSQILSTKTFQKEDGNNWLVYPSDDKSKLQIVNTAASVSGKLDVSLVNMKGQIMQSNTLETSSGNNNYSLNLNQSLTRGIYILKIKDNGVTNSRKILINR